MGSPVLLQEKLVESAPTPPPERPAGGHRKVLRIGAIALGLLFATEAALQVRSHLATGDSVFNLVFAERHYVEDPETGLTLLAPNRTFLSNGVTLKTNSLGLRSPEISMARTPGSWRIAVVGASTVFDPYARDNDQTFPARLEQRLRRDSPGRQVEVVNAGIVGFGLAEERIMLEKRVAALRPDLTVIYTGFNDFLAYCRESPGKVREDHGLPTVSLPSWLLTVDLLKKNTVFLRTVGSRQANKRDANAVGLEHYRERLEALARRAGELGLPVVFTTNARAYRRDQPLEEQITLSESDRFYTHCFDLNGLHTLYDRHNAVIREVAAAYGIPLVDLAGVVPGGPRYFADSHHFSAEGGRLVAERLADFILSRGLLPT